MGVPASNVYVRALRNWWWAALAVPALAVGAALHLTDQQPRLYRASATAAVMPSPEITNPSEVMRGLETLERRTIIATFASMAGTRDARYAAAAALGLTTSQVSGYRVQASVLPSTNIIRITVQGGDGEQVSALANALVGIVADQAREMYRVFEIQPLEGAATAGAPFHPDPVRNATTAGILGLFCGILLALLLESLRFVRSGRRASMSASLPAVPAGDEMLAAWGGRQEP